MPKKTVYFMALLANVDSSILEMRLDHAFKIKSMSTEQGVSLISRLTHLPFQIVQNESLLRLRCVNPAENRFYCITNMFQSEKGDESWPQIERFGKDLFHAYLNPKIRLMRLFKEGNIVTPAYYYYLREHGVPKILAGVAVYDSVLIEPYRLEKSEIPALLTFLQDTKLPFRESFLQLAFQNFELSYRSHDRNLSFLSLMTSLEALFNLGKGEVAYRISRNTAIVVGKDEHHSDAVFSRMQKSYDKRSKMLHQGQLNIISEKELLTLRNYVRESIKRTNRLGKNKDQLATLLNRHGFGDKRPWMT